MHMQLRAQPVQSPADLAKLLKLVADNGFNIIAAGGSDVEKGGEFAFAVEDEDDPGRPQRVLDLLHQHHYPARLVDVDYCIVANNPGELHKCVANHVAKRAGRDKKVKDLAIGPWPDDQVLVQVFFE